MSQCIVPNWNLRQERQEEQVEGEERNRSPHVQSHQNLSYVVPMCNHEVTELTWENGQLSLHGLGGINLPSQTSSKQTWSNKQGDTLESIVHQATTSFNNNFPSSSAGKLEQNSAHIVEHINQDAGNLSSMAGGKWRDNSSHMSQIEQNHDQVKENSFCGEKWRENPNHMQVQAQVQQMKGKWKEKYLTRHVQMDAEKGVKVSSMDASNSAGKLKRVRCESERKGNFQMEEISACGSASATFCRDTDTTMMTWPANSFESPRSMKTARTVDDDSLYHDCSENQDGERITKGESFRSQSSARRSRAAAIHNLSERRRRDRINQKMKTLQKLVPNASKTDKASMLDEVIEYLKQLQAQVHMMSNARNMPQMAVMPLGMQQQLQMSLLARMAGMGMGMGIGMGMLDVNNLARNMPPSFPSLIHAAAPLGGTAPSFVSPPFSMPPVVPPSTPLKTNVDAATINTSIPNFSEAYNTFLAQQSMNMDFLNKISALYRQQNSQPPSRKPVSLSLPNDAQRE